MDSAWAAYNWASQCPGSSTAASIAGETALEVDLTCDSFNGEYLVNWNSYTDLATYSVLSFDIYLTQPGDLSRVQMIVQYDYNSQTALQLLSNYIPNATPGSFYHVTIPLTAFTPGTSYLGFAFAFGNSSPTGSIFYLNHVVISSH